MLQSIELKNFKCIKKKHFQLRNLNVLLGLNGQGKSSFIQSLLAIRQSGNVENISLNGDLTKLGTTKDVLYQYSKKEDLSMILCFSNRKPFTVIYKYAIDADYFNAKELIRANNNDDYVIVNDDFVWNKNFQYLNAHRIEPKSMNNTSYSKVVDENNIGKHGEYTAHYIELRGTEEVHFENIVHPKSVIHDEVTNKNIINKTLINQINLWLGEISPGVSVRTTKVSSDFVMLEYDFKQPNLGHTNKFKPENVGFGISYALHVITALLIAKPGQMLIIENPESHIHPRGQAELGRLIGLVAQNDVQIIIETHSDHLLNGIRVAVKEGDIDKDRVIAFYFEKIVDTTEQYARITDIEIDKNGTLSAHPKNLLDEWSNQLSKLI